MKYHLAALYLFAALLLVSLFTTISRVQDLERLVILQENNTDALIRLVRIQVQNTDSLIHTVGSQSLQPSR